MGRSLSPSPSSSHFIPGIPPQSGLLAQSPSVMPPYSPMFMGKIFFKTCLSFKKSLFISLDSLDDFGNAIILDFNKNICFKKKMVYFKLFTFPVSANLFGNAMSRPPPPAPPHVQNIGSPFGSPSAVLAQRYSHHLLVHLYIG